MAALVFTTALGTFGKFNQTFYLTATTNYDVSVQSIPVTPCPTPCNPDKFQVYTKAGVKVVDIAVKPDMGVYAVMLPPGSYQIHMVGDGYSKLQFNAKDSK